MSSVIRSSDQPGYEVIMVIVTAGHPVSACRELLFTLVIFVYIMY